MKRLKIILHSKYLYIILFLVLFIYFYLYINVDRKSNIDTNDHSFVGIITNYKINKDVLTIEVKGSEKIIGYYYFKSIEEIESFNIELGEKVLLEGEFKEPSNNTIPNSFNYKNYLKHKYIYMTMSISSIKSINKSNNLFYKIKNSVIKHINSYKSKSYLETFILGDKSMIDNDIFDTYRSNGVSHLLAISGMHISLLSMIILFVLNKTKMKKEITLLIVSSFLLFYMFLVGLSPSIVRSCLLFSLLSLNKIFKLELKTINVLLLTFILLVFINPFIIYDIGFIYSFSISFFLILFQNKINNKSYIKSLLMISFISFLVGLPITLYNFYEINFLGIILNLIFVPYVSMIVFPFSLITFFIPLLDNILLILVNILEWLSYYSSKINIFMITFGKISVLFIVLYYALLIIFLKTNKKVFFIGIVVLLFFQYNINSFIKSKYIIVIDVGQGDSILIKDKKITLVDTGGVMSYKKEDWKHESKSITDTKLLPLFKSLGIRKLDYLILTHGDYDHMGEAINLVNSIKIDKVIFNCGKYNSLEKRLIDLLDKKKIDYYKCINKLDSFTFLNTQDFNNENDNSNVLYFKFDKYKFILMGDASIKTEKEIMNKYNLSDIDVLKVGHHGSKTSSSKEFVEEINPKYSIISVGNKNKFGHPNNEVLEVLNNTKIYRTDQDGSIIFKIKNNKLKIETCSP